MFLLVLFLFIPMQAFAWGSRGHATIEQVAVYLLADQNEKNNFLKDYSFQLAYYSNVPDYVWKEPATYEKERYNHYMDWEIFARKLTAEQLKTDFDLDRIAFNKKHLDIPFSAGRAWWRIREFEAKLRELQAELAKNTLSIEKRHEIQADWLVTAGTMGHYIGDLSQPLHCTENFDGQMTNQKGVHAFFENTVVNELHPELEVKVLALAKKQAKKFFKDVAKKPELEILQALTKHSNARLAELLSIDKKYGREHLKQATLRYQNLIIERMAESSLVLAEFWRRVLGEPFNTNRFYNFYSTPKFVEAPHE